MSIKRGPIPADTFTIISNAWLRDPMISWKAKGLLAYIASHAAGYRLTTDQIIAEGRDGRDAVRAGLAELEAAGYLRRVEVRDERGQLAGIDHELVEPDRKPVAGKPGAGSDQAEQGVSAAQSSAGKPGHGDLSSKKTKKTSSEEDADASPEPEEKPENAGDIVAAFVDYCAAQSVKLPRQVIARYGREIKIILDDKFPPNLIKHALNLMLQRGKHTHPALLPSFVVEVQGQSRPVSAPPAASRPGYQTAAEKAEQERQRQRAIAEIADRLADEWQVDPTDYLRNKQVTETATRIYEDKAGQIHGDQSTTCSATGYSGTNSQAIVDAEWTEVGPRREVTAG